MLHKTFLGMVAFNLILFKGYTSFQNQEILGGGEWIYIYIVLKPFKNGNAHRERERGNYMSRKDKKTTNYFIATQFKYIMTYDNKFPLEIDQTM